MHNKPHTRESIEKMRRAHTGRKASAETRRKMSESHKGKCTYWSVGSTPHNALDLTGQRFGRLVVQGKAFVRNQRTRWNCLCDCGKRVVVVTNHLTSGRTQSCGCLQKQRAGQVNSKPIAPGARFGRWVVVRECGRTSKQRVLYLCQCDCGKTGTVGSSQLLGHRTQSCGCYQSEITAKLHTIHGLCKMGLYNRWSKRVRKHHNRDWLPEMEILLHKIQTRCVVCGSTKRLTVDHVKPNIRGNGLYPGNAVVLCQVCNSTKYQKTLASLPPDWQSKIAYAAIDFAQEWEYVIINEQT